MSFYESRRLARTIAGYPVILTAENGEIITGESLDISLVGMLISCQKTWSLGTECKAELFMGEPCTKVETQCTIVRVTDEGLALEITGVDSSCFQDFRDFIVSIAEEPEVMDAEIASRPEMIPDLY